MATRFYLPSSGGLPSGVADVTLGGGWEINTGAVKLAAGRTKSNTPLANGDLRTKNGTSNNDRLDRVYVTEPLTAQTISGTFSMVIRGAESNLALNAWLQVMIRVVSGNGSTVKATLYAGSTATGVNTTNPTSAENSEFDQGTTLTTRIKSAIALSSYTCADGDRLSFEIGFRGSSTNTTYTVTLGYGDPTSTADLPLTADSPTAGVPWIELSRDLTFSGPPDEPPAGDGEISFRSGSFGVGSENEFGDGVDAVVPKPAGMAVGDYLVAFVTTSGDSPNTTALTSPGWDPTFYDDGGASGSATNSAVLTKAATSADVSGSGWTFSKVGDTATDQFAVHVVAIPGVDLSNPIVAGPTMVEGPFSTSTDIETPALTIPAGLPGQALLLCNWVAFWWMDVAGANRWTIQTAGVSEAVDYGAAWSQMLTGYALVGAGSTGAKVAVAADNASPAPRGHAIALRPAGGGAAAPTNQFFHVLAGG
jgi:hypothetical protein